MPKTARTSRSLQKKFEAEEAAPPLPPFADDGETEDLHWKVKTAAVCELFCRGMTVREIRDRMLDEFGEPGRMSREEPYSLVSRAAKRGWLKFDPPRDVVSESRIRDRYKWLKNAQVVHSARIQPVALRGAEVLLNLVSKYAQRSRPRKTVRIGFAGGRSVGLLARLFAQLLTREKIQLPDKIVLQSLVAGFDPSDPATDPNTFFSFFLDDSSMRVQTEFVALHAPPIVREEDLDRLRRIVEIDEAYEAAKHVDIIVTSGSEWKDEHSPLKRSMTRERDVYDRLSRLGCVGDILWRPIGPAGPIEEPTDIRAMTLVELSDLPERIRSGTQVLLMLGPCGMCRRHKGSLLGAIMNHREQLVTHLVTDTRTAVTILPEEKESEER